MSSDEITRKSLKIAHRKLPHWQIGGSWYFVTFRTQSIEMSDEARRIVLQETESASKGRFELAIALAMPDHVHLLLCPLELTEGIYHSLSSILKLIKGRSANRINALLGRKGSFWQKESFDRIVRDQHEWQEKYQYILNNPVKAGLALRPTEYSWVVLGDKYK